MRRLAPAILILVAAEAAVAADDAATGLEFVRRPVSVRQQATGAYGGFDVLQVFGNPALLSSQPRHWAVAVSDQTMFDGAQNLWAAGAAWAPDYGSKGSFGVAVAASGVSSDPVAVMDLSGLETGQSVATSSLRVGVAGYWKRKWLSLGLGAGQASESLSGAATASTGAFLVDAGAVAEAGAWTGGAAFRFRGARAASEIGAGGAYRLNGGIKGLAGVEVAAPITGAAKPVLTAGVAWYAIPLLDVRAGAEMPLGVAGTAPVSPRAGITLHYGGLDFDYAFAAGLEASAGSSHLVSLAYGMGGARGTATARPVRGFAQAGDKVSLAVADFNAVEVSSGDAVVAADLLRSALVQGGAFNLVEKANMEKILAEQAFQQTGCTTQECAVKLGKVLNVTYLAVGTFTKTMGEYFLSVRVVEVESARVVYTDEASAKAIGELREGIRGLAQRLTAAVNTPH